MTDMGELFISWEIALRDEGTSTNTVRAYSDLSGRSSPGRRELVCPV
jgi:hypothetical protein